jgi:hypothetical protein
MSPFYEMGQKPVLTSVPILINGDKNLFSSVIDYFPREASKWHNRLFPQDIHCNGNRLLSTGSFKMAQ